MAKPRTHLDRDDVVEIDLRHGRWRHFRWGMASLALGVLLVLRLDGWVKLAGVLLALGGVRPSIAFVRTLLHPAGSIVVRPGQVTLTPWLCSGTALHLPISEVHNAYVLHRTLPWTTSGPVLVIEADQGAWEYPRDWFATDGDQRRILGALNRQLGVLES